MELGFELSVAPISTISDNDVVQSPPYNWEEQGSG